MAWVTASDVAGECLVDYWDVVINNRRWYRKLDIKTNEYRYRFEDLNLPYDLDATRIPDGLQDKSVMVEDLRQAVSCVPILQGLTVSLCGTLKTISVKFPALKVQADQLRESAEEAVVSAQQKYDEIVGKKKTVAAISDTIAKCIDELSKANYNASAWSRTQQIGDQRNPLTAVAQRVVNIATNASQALRRAAGNMG